MSPRMASRLWAAAIMLADTYEGRVHLLKSLPPIAQRLVDEVWMDRFVSCFDALALRFERREVDATRIARCTAEEMALHLIIEQPRARRSMAVSQLTCRCRQTRTVTSTSTPSASSSSGITTSCCCSMRHSTGSSHPTGTSVSSTCSSTIIHEHGFFRSQTTATREPGHEIGSPERQHEDSRRLISGPVGYRRPLSASAVARSWKSDYVTPTRRRPRPHS